MKRLVSSLLLIIFSTASHATTTAPVHAANNTVLSATASSVGTVVRDGFATVGDAPPITFAASGSACSMSDGGSQVPTSDGKCWIARFDTYAADVRQFGAKCDGTTDDSTAFTKDLLVYQSVYTPSGRTCVVKNVVVDTNRTFDGNLSVFKAASGADYIFKATGYAPQIRNVHLIDPDDSTLRSTTLAAAASPGATTISVASASGLAAGNPIAITLNSGRRFLTKIIGISGTNVTIEDPVPVSATACSTSGGTGYTLNHGAVVRGGVGAPATVQFTAVVSGVPTACTVLVPGSYTAAPSANAVTISGPGDLQYEGVGALVTLTTSAAAAGATVQSAFGVVLIDKAVYANIINIIINNVSVGIQVAGSGSGTPTSFYTSQCTIANLNSDTVRLVGFFLDTKVSGCHLLNSYFMGKNPQFGVAGIYIDSQSPGLVAPGGNLFDQVTLLGWQSGVLLRAAQLDTFSNFISDTNRDYGWEIYENSIGLLGTGQLGATFTGPGVVQTPSSVGSQGIGMWISPNNTLLRTNGIETLTGNMFGVIDDGHAIHSADDTFLFGVTPALVNGNSTVYLGPTGPSDSFAGAAWVSPGTCTIMDFTDLNDTPPGMGQQMTAQIVKGGTAIGSKQIIVDGGYASGSVPIYANIQANESFAIRLITSLSATPAHHRYTVRLRC